MGNLVTLGIDPAGHLYVDEGNERKVFGVISSLKNQSEGYVNLYPIGNVVSYTRDGASHIKQAKSAKFRRNPDGSMEVYTPLGIMGTAYDQMVHLENSKDIVVNGSSDVYQRAALLFALTIEKGKNWPFPK